MKRALPRHYAVSHRAGLADLKKKRWTRWRWEEEEGWGERWEHLAIWSDLWGARQVSPGKNPFVGVLWREDVHDSRR